MSKPRRIPSVLVRRRARLRMIQVMVFFIAFYLLSLISWIIPLRPSHSDMENRDLTAFPAFSIEALANGSFFDGINKWFADTFPMRDGFIGLSNTVKGFYGIADTSVHGDVQTGDDIPDTPSAVTTQTQTDTSASPNATTPTDVQTTDPVTTTTGDQHMHPPGSEDVPAETNGAILTIGDSGFEYYNFVQSVADSYIATISRAGDQLAGKATVYDIIVPTSMDICVPQSVRDGLNTSDQKKAIQYMFGSMSGTVKKIDVFDTLFDANQNGEYVYFRTDHHWTALGAYRSYECFCNIKGIRAASLGDFTQHQFDNYLGSFYRDTQSSSMAANPDVVIAYEPKATNSLTMTTADGETMEYSIITDVTEWDQLYKYNTFIGGDQPISEIHNPNITDGSSCVLVKESFGNAFAPFLVANYETVYIIDYRYFHKVDERSLQQFVTDNNIDDVIFLNNMSATRNEDLMNYLAYFAR